MAGGFIVDLDDREMRRFIWRFSAPEVDKLLRKGTTAAGAAMKRVIRPAIPVGATGNLRGSLKAARVRANTSIGVVVGPMGRKASHRHLVAGGTKPHVIGPNPKRSFRAVSTPEGVFAHVRHPGARPNRWLDRVDEPAYAAGAAALDAVIDAHLRKP